MRVMRCGLVAALALAIFGAGDASAASVSYDGSRIVFSTTTQFTPDDADNQDDTYVREGQTTTLVTQGVHGNGAVATTFSGMSSDASRIWFTSTERLTDDDTDVSQDVFERSGGTTKLISTAPLAGGGLHTATWVGATPDGSHVYFSTDERLSPDDTDNAVDVYDRSGGTTTLVSTGSANVGASFRAVSTDGTKVFFTTSEALTAGDTDTAIDIYERSGGSTTLISAGSASVGVFFNAASADGSHVFFTTTESLVAGDTDTVDDVYERSGGMTTLVSTSSTAGNAALQSFFVGANADGTRVLFYTGEQMVPGDTDSQVDVFERSGGTTTQITVGQINGNGAFAFDTVLASDDGTHVFFRTQEQLVSGDTDNANDIYERFGGTTTRVSAGEINGNGAADAIAISASADGSVVLFATNEQLVAADTDAAQDFYVRSGGTTTLASDTAGTGTTPAGTAVMSRDGTHVVFSSDDPFAIGGVSPNAYDRAGGVTRLVTGRVTQDAAMNAVSTDGTRAIFSTGEPLLPGEDEFAGDVFARSAGATSQLSLGPAGTGNPREPSTFGAASSDASRVLFYTREQLVAGDSDGSMDVYERTAGTTTLVSTGDINGNGAFDALPTAYSEDGTRAFFRTAEPLVAGDANGLDDIYERSSGTTVRRTAGALSGQVAVSPDGARVYYESPDQITGGDSDASTDVYESANGTTTLMSAGAVNGNGAFNANLAAIVPDGVLFQTGEQLVPGDTNGVSDVYRRSGGATTLTVPAGVAGGTGFVAVSSDATHVLFGTTASLVAADGDASPDYYDEHDGIASLITGAAAGMPAATAIPQFGRISQDGTHIFFTTTDPLVPEDNDASADVYAYSAGTTTLVSRVPNGPGNDAFPVVFQGATPDGSHVYFRTSEALTPDDTDSTADVYERVGGTVRLVSVAQSGSGGGGNSSFTGVSDDGSHVFLNSQERLVSADTDAQNDIYDRYAGHTYLVSTVAPAPVVAQPTLSGVSPAGPANAGVVTVNGTAPAGSTVRVYTSSDCSGSPVATGSAASFASPGLAVGVPQDATTTLRATATDDQGYDSACSSSSAAFTEDSTPPAAPTLAGTTPASGADDNAPEVTGAAEAAATVRLFASSDCTGAPLAVGSAASFASPGLTIVVLDNSTTSISATATDAAGNTSACSGAISYQEVTPAPQPQTVFVEVPVLTPPTLEPTDTTPPETTLTAGPKPTITASKATFRFTASEPGSTFRCRLDKKPFAACKSPLTIKGLKVGKHTFEVVAVDAAGNADPTPARKSFRVKRAAPKQ